MQHCLRLQTMAVCAAVHKMHLAVGIVCMKPVELKPTWLRSVMGIFQARAAKCMLWLSCTLDRW